MSLLTKKEKDVLDLIDSGVPIICRNTTHISNQWEVFNLKPTTTARDILSAMSSGWEYKVAPPKPRSIWKGSLKYEYLEPARLFGKTFDSKQECDKAWKYCPFYEGAVEFVEKMD